MSDATGGVSGFGEDWDPRVGQALTVLFYGAAFSLTGASLVGVAAGAWVGVSIMVVAALTVLFS